MSHARPDIDELVAHVEDKDCDVCIARSLATSVVAPAVAMWEVSHRLPRCSLALHGAVGLLATMLDEGYSREEIDAVVADMLDEIEAERQGWNMLLDSMPEGSA